MSQIKTMEQAIEFLRNLGMTVTDKGLIMSVLPEGEEGLALVDSVEDETGFTIINNQLESQED